MRLFTGLLLSFYMLFLASFMGCVSTEKFKDLQADNNRNQLMSDSLKAVIDGNRHQEYELLRAKNNLKEYSIQLDNTEQRYNNLDKSYKNLLERYDEVLFQNQALLANSSEEKQTLTEELGQKQRELDQKARELDRLEYNLKNLETNLNSKQQQLNDANNNDQSAQYDQQLGELQKMLADKENTLRTLRSRINKALLGFSAADLSVSEANGRIYVSLSQNLLFASNSASIDWKGKTAIKKLAEVLQRNPDIEIAVEGHTDSDGSAEKNWDLSVSRATAVVKVLTGYGVNPKQITASGRSLFYPIASNRTAAGKAQNRRTEIILSPKLDELYQIINQ